MRLHQWNSQFKNEITALTNKPWMQYVWLFLIILIAAALRLYKLGEWRFWFDEIFTINRASSHYSDIYGLIRNLPAAAIWMPPSVILTGFVMNTLGISEWSSRLVPAVIGIISIPVIYFPTKKEFGSAFDRVGGFDTGLGAGTHYPAAKYFSPEDPHMIRRMDRNVSGYFLRVPYRCFDDRLPKHPGICCMWRGFYMAQLDG